MKTHTDAKPFSCVNCKKEFRRKDVMKKHVGSCQKPISNIEKDNENLLQPGIKLREEGIQLLESKFKTCDICQERFASNSQLNAHAKTHQVITFKVCHKGFASNANLKKHLLVHDNEKKYKCNTCDKPFTRKDYLNSHLKTHQSNK